MATNYQTAIPKLARKFGAEVEYHKSLKLWTIQFGGKHALQYTASEAYWSLRTLELYFRAEGKVCDKCGSAEPSVQLASMSLTGGVKQLCKYCK